MTHGDIIARQPGTAQAVRLSWENATITRLEQAPASTLGNLWVLPALVDVQVNGYGGVDFQQDGLTLEQLLSAARRLRVDGCARWLLTLITDDWLVLTTRLRHLRALREQSDELQQVIAGWHIEGPFLSAEPGFCGAHQPALMRDPALTHVRELRKITGHDPLLLTVAPERKGAIEAIALAVSLGIKISLGHTNASAEQLRQAIRAGATGFTHLGNGCPRALDRHDNILWRVLEIATDAASGLMISLIPDGNHVSPVPFRLFHQLLDPARVYYTTDAMSAAGAGPGRYRLGALEVEVGDDQVVRQPGRTNFAGSALRPIDGVFRAAAMLNRPWQEAWRRFSEAPARLMGWNADLAVGGEATFCLLTADEAGGPGSLTTIVRGQ